MQIHFKIEGNVPLKIDNNALYAIIKTKIETEITSGIYKPGDALPTEFKLCHDYDVSRTTIRLALQQLELEGRIHKVQGKGTFVSKPKIHQSLTSVNQGFREQMIAQGLEPKTKVLSIKVIPAEASLAEHLNINEKDPVNQLIRIRYADEEPLQYETSYIPWRMAPGLVDEDCHGSLFELLRLKFNIQIHRTLESIEPILISDHISKHMNISTGTPAFSVETTTYNNDQSPLEFSIAVFRGDRSKFTVERHYTNIR